MNYTADVSSIDALVIEGASDIVDLALDGRALTTIARFGATELVPIAGSPRATSAESSTVNRSFKAAAPHLGLFV